MSVTMYACHIKEKWERYRERERRSNWNVFLELKPAYEYKHAKKDV